MISRKTLRIAGAAILGTLVGTGPAHAIVAVDGDGDVSGGIIVVNESFIAKTEVDGVDYHHLPADFASTSATDTNTLLDTRFVFGVLAGAGDTVSLTFNFGDNLILTTDLKDQATTGTAIPQVQVFAADGTTAIAGLTINPVLRSGGKAKDKTAVYTFTATGASIPADATVLLQQHGIGIRSNSDGGTKGTVTMTTRIGGAIVDIPPATSTLTDAYQTKNVLQETVVPNNLSATVAQDFASFGLDAGGNPRKTASLGEITLSVDTTGTPYTTEPSYLFNPPTLTAGADGDIATSGTVTFAGDLSFVDNVFLSSASGCSPVGTSLVTDGEGEGVKVWKSGDDRPSVADVNGNHVCITVKDDVTIPETEAYTATTSYQGLTNAAFPPMGSTLELGRIIRDGAEARIPYLTTNSRYNQRIVLRNRGSSAASYSMRFDTESGVTAEAMDGATGMVPGNSILTLRARDVVSLEGGSRTAATVILSAAHTTVDVATVQVNLSTGATDTVTYSSAER